MKKMTTWMAILFAALLLGGCNKGKSMWLPTATGAINEVLVVMTEQLKNDTAGKALLDVLDGEIPGLPQPEPHFRFYTTTPEHFDNLLRPMRNIVVLEISSQSTQPRFSYQKDVWAKPQVVLTIKSPDAAQMATFIAQNGQAIQDFFVGAELVRGVEYLKKNHNTATSDSLYTDMGIKALLPEELTAIKSGKDFFWTSNAKSSGRMDFVVYSTPYTSEKQFDLEQIVATRDSVLKANIPGPLDGSYMQTAQEIVPPIYRARNFNGKYAAEVRGLWEVNGAVMGGPFVSLTRLDEPNGRLITTEVFIFNPEKNKRNLLRRAESALYTVQLPQETALPEVPVIFESTPNK